MPRGKMAYHNAHYNNVPRENIALKPVLSTCYRHANMEIGMSLNYGFKNYFRSQITVFEN
jgi:hypothetical protein